VNDSESNVPYVEDLSDDVVVKETGRHNIHLPRQNLREIMIKKLHPGSILWGKKLTEIVHENDPNKSSDIQIKFNDNSSYKTSLVVAADGIYSTLRDLKVQQKQQGQGQGQGQVQGLKYLGLMVVLGYCEGRLLREDGSRIQVGISYNIHKHRHSHI
jgi:2-polyprenyl-6-methoxyphenol hydroxylase-like FAD-dependent oxidoreductase